MPFNSISFIILFPAVVVFYYLVPKKIRHVWLALISLVFYLFAYQDMGFVVILLIMSGVTYISGIALSNIDSTVLKKLVFVLTLVIELGVLFTFKYLDFTLGLAGSSLRLSLAMPVGMSFYMFQAISYLTDVYRGDISCEYNPVKMILYLSFFLTIVSGPINRAGDILPQFSAAPGPSLERAKRGMQKMLWGYFLKLAIAGRLAIIVDRVYADTASFSGGCIALAALSYMFMLYCDFEGYSQIAIGSGYILGLKMKENFRQPFFSLSMSEMWRRWHVSLSSWFRDYLYIPLGGNRKGIVRKYVNIFIVLFLSGVWHGANMTFFVWGALNGAFIILGQLLLPGRDRLAVSLKDKLCKSETSRLTFDRVREVIKRIGVYILISFTFIFFANDSVSSAALAVRSIFTGSSPASFAGDIGRLGIGRLNLVMSAVMVVFVFIADGAANKRSCDTPGVIKRIPTPLRWVIYYALLIAILFSANLTGKEFVYSRM
ncbi:MAG: hypothetical protein K6E49_05890 [Lachnospiraceae bacterium]|nr:hypothetical protein [Lachnospiraceae bacterium]